MKEYKFNGSRNTRGERHGYGETILTNGDQYKGDYKNGLRHGKGEYLFTSSLTLDANVPVTKTVKYIGHYEENKKTGHGIFIYPNGSRYEGEWKDNKRHGNGTYYYSNGDVYSGDWVQDCRHGNGTYEYFTDQMKYIGMWRKGKRSGEGKLVYKSSYYDGQFRHDKMLGPGKYVFENGTIHYGEYVVDEVRKAKGVGNEFVTQWRCKNVCK